MARTYRHNDEEKDELLQDGQIGRVRFRDSQAHDGRGGIPGHKPGFAFTRDDAALARVDAAYEAYENSLQDAWRGPISEVADEHADLAVSDAAAHSDRTEPRPMDEVYRLYDETLASAWKSPR